MKKNENEYVPYTDSLMFAAENLVRACKAATKEAHKLMGSGFSHEEYIIVEMIFLNPGIIQLDIAKKLFMQRSYVCKVLIKLEEAGYIKKETAIKGKRKTIMKLYLTEKGRVEYNKVRNFINILMKKLTEERLLKNSETAEYLRFLTEDVNKRYNLKL